MYLEYDSNNSGGGWWLEDKDWYTLEKAGWEVKWRKDDPYWEKMLDKDGRWLGALASSAILRNILSESQAREAIDQFDVLTGSNHRATGCECCGPPHNFTLYNDNGSYHSSLSQYDYNEDSLY